MMNGGARLDDLPLDVMFNVAYAELYRQTEIMVGAPVFDEKAKEHPLVKAYASIDTAISDAVPDPMTGLPQWVVRNAPVAADGTRVAPEPDVPDVSPPSDEPMPPPGMKPGIRQ